MKSLFLTLFFSLLTAVLFAETGEVKTTPATAETPADSAESKTPVTGEVLVKTRTCLENIRLLERIVHEGYLQGLSQKRTLFDICSAVRPDFKAPECPAGGYYYLRKLRYTEYWLVECSQHQPPKDLAGPNDCFLEAFQLLNKSFMLGASTYKLKKPEHYLFHHDLWQAKKAADLGINLSGGVTDIYLDRAHPEFKREFREVFLPELKNLSRILRVFESQYITDIEKMDFYNEIRRGLGGFYRWYAEDSAEIFCSIVSD
ncbi:MAG: hypothetical protein PHW04_01935 [Candidatus Wallbacteria bacterium]|nr:hypothetical protein [Candidatus Wallbacteria bacterium]